MTDKEQGNTNYLVRERDGDSKYFSFSSEHLVGKTMHAEYNKDVNF